MTERELEDRFPSIPWRSPLKATRTDGAWGYACRFCVALHGLKATEIDALPKTEAAVAEHIAAVHGRPAP